MRYKLFGKSGLRVAELALGTMTFGEDWGWGASKSDSRAIFEAYAEAGGNFIDTANRYTDGTAEKFVGEFISTDRAHFILSTKYTLFTRRGDPNASGSGRKNMVQSIEASLKRLQTDYIDVFWVHAWDPLTPVEEVMRGLDDLVRSGKVLYVGVSDTPAWVIAQANTMAELRGWSRFIGLQSRYSLADRAAERDLLPMAAALDIALCAWSVLGSGALTAKYMDEKTAPKDGRAAQWGGPGEHEMKLAAELAGIAKEIGCTPAQAAINWIRLQQGKFLIPIIPILGARRLDQMQDNLSCLSFTLSDDHLQRLDIASQIALGFPHDFLASEGIRDIIYGGGYSKIDNHRRP